MSTYASVLIDAVARDLLDEDANDADRRWPSSEHLENLNSGERQLVFLLPTAYTVTEVFQLVPGTLQTLPDGTGSQPQAVELVSVNRNDQGSAILPVEREVLDRMDPGWHIATGNATVDHYCTDTKDRNHFSVYPPQPAAGMGSVEVTYSAVPPEIVATAGPSYDVNINLEDVYIEPLKHYMKFAAYAKNAASSPFDANRALAEWNHFVTLIGRKDLVEKRYDAIRKVHGNRSDPISQ